MSFQLSRKRFIKGGRNAPHMRAINDIDRHNGTDLICYFQIIKYVREI